MRKGPLLAVMVVCILVGATHATASTMTISPSGPINETSIGKATFAVGESRIACNVRFTGTLFSSATGELTSEPNPAVNPQIGTLNPPTVSECAGGVVRVLSGTALAKRVVVGLAPGRWIMEQLPILVLTEDLSLLKCLYDEAIISLWDTIAGRLVWEITRLLRKTPLSILGCGELTITGTFSFEETGGRLPTMTLR